MKRIELFGSVRDGKLIINRKQLAGELKEFGNHGIRFIIEQQSTRSNQQNRYYWSCVTILASHLGYLKEELHEIIKYKFLKREKVNEISGEVFEYLESTAKLNKEDFSEFMNHFQQWSAETFGVILPSPNEQLTIDTDATP